MSWETGYSLRYLVLVGGFLQELLITSILLSDGV